MFSAIGVYLDRIGDGILDLTVPHHRNNHRPYLIRSSGLLFFLAVILLSQTVANISAGNGRVLGFATEISVSEIINLTNQERANDGLNQLKENNNLDRAARLKASDMFSKDYWAHYAPDGTSPWYFFSLVGYKYSTAGENLARDFATSGGVVSAWMASEGHRANILNSSYTEIGVAVVNGNLEGEDTTLVVQLFGRPLSFASSNASSGEGSNSQPGKLEANMKVPTTQNGQTENTQTLFGKEEAEFLPTSSVNGVFSLPSLVRNSTSSQKVTLTLLIFIALLFLLDSAIVFRKRHARSGSHSFAHASMILILIACTLLYGQGSIF